MHTQVWMIKCYWNRWAGSCWISNEGCSEAILPFNLPVVKSAWCPVYFSWILFPLKLPGWREALSWECCSTCEVGCACVRAYEMCEYVCASCMSTFVSVCSLRAYVGVNVRVNLCVWVCQCIALCLFPLYLVKSLIWRLCLSRGLLKPGWQHFT